MLLAGRELGIAARGRHGRGSADPRLHLWAASLVAGWVHVRRGRPLSQHASAPCILYYYVCIRSAVPFRIPAAPAARQSDAFIKPCHMSPVLGLGLGLGIGIGERFGWNSQGVLNTRILILNRVNFDDLTFTSASPSPASTSQSRRDERLTIVVYAYYY